MVVDTTHKGYEPSLGGVIYPEMPARKKKDIWEMFGESSFF
jgi:hypothetical protein